MYIYIYILKQSLPNRKQTNRKEHIRTVIRMNCFAFLQVQHALESIYSTKRALFVVPDSPLIWGTVELQLGIRCLTSITPTQQRTSLERFHIYFSIGP